MDLKYMKQLKYKILLVLILLSLALSVMADCTKEPATCISIGESQKPIAQLSAKELNDNFASLSEPQIAKLSVTQRAQLKPETIKDHLHKLGNLKDFPAAKDAIKQKYSVTVDSFGPGATINQAGRLTSSTGSKDVLTLGPNYEKGTITVDDKGKIIYTPTQSKGLTNVVNPNIEDTFTLKSPISIMGLKSKDGRFGLKGTVNYEKGKYYVQKKKKVTISTADGEYVVSSLENNVNLYFDQTEKPEGNFFRINRAHGRERGFSMGSIKGGEVDVIPVRGNSLLGMTRRKYEKINGVIKRDANGKPIFATVADGRDYLKITVSGGDGLTIEDRGDQGKTPLFKHSNGGGQTKLLGFRLRAKINKGKVRIKTKPLGDFSRLRDQANSVALELVSDAFPEDRIITSSSNRWKRLRNGKKISGNNLDTEVTNSIETNNMKTMDDLNAKYPTAFGLKPSLTLLDAEILPENYQPTANMVQIVDQFIRENPHYDKFITAMEFSAWDNSAFGHSISGFGPYFSLGEHSLDPVGFKKHPVRKLTGPMGVLRHEFVHARVHKLAQKDFLRYGKGSVQFPLKENQYASTFQKQTDDVAQDLLNRLAKSPEWRDILNDYNELFKDVEEVQKNELMEKTFQVQTSPAKEIDLIGSFIKSGANAQKAKNLHLRTPSRELLTRFRNELEYRTGLDGPHGLVATELLAIFKENTPQSLSTKLRNNPDLLEPMRRLAQQGYELELAVDSPPEEIRKAQALCKAVSLTCKPCVEYAAACN